MSRLVSRILLFVALLTALILTLVAPVIGQDVTPPPDGSGLDSAPPGATPVPLPTRMSRPAAYAASVTPLDERASLAYFFQVIGQGETGLARVDGENIMGVSAVWQEGLVDFWEVAGDAWYGLLSVHMESDTGRQPLIVSVTFTDGTRTQLNSTVEVVLGGFIGQTVNLPPTLGYLLDAATERNELARLASMTVLSTPERYWDETGFQLPILAALTSPFGAIRTFNSALYTRHTGWDIRCTLGTPVVASAAGEVVFADTLPIRGSYVLIDHGMGVYSGYAHFSETLVSLGDRVEKGQLIGATGNSGRTSGPHFHWEMAVNGRWVNSVGLLQLWMP